MQSLLYIFLLFSCSSCSACSGDGWYSSFPFSLPSLSPSSSSSLFFFWNCKHHSYLRATKMNTGRICPLGHNLPTSDIQSFHSDCGPLVAPYTDFKNSCVPGMPPKVCGRLWTISGPLAEKIPPFQVLFLFFFFKLLLLHHADARTRARAGILFHSLSTWCNSTGVRWPEVQEIQGAVSSVVRDPHGSLSVLWSFFKYFFFSPQQIVFYFFSVGWIMSSDLLNYGL